MIRIEVISINGEAPPQPMSAEFGQAGGTIGRASNNQLMLPDPSCMVSRVHAQVAVSGGRAVITDQSINALSVNGRPLGKGNSTTLNAGDRIVVGHYTLEVRAGSAGMAVALPPRGTAPLAAAAPPVAAPPPRPASPVVPPAAAPLLPNDDDPFADLMSTPPAAKAPPAGPLAGFAAPRPAGPLSGAAAPASSAARPALPDDFDFLADPMKEPPKPAAAPLPASGLGGPLDDFGLGVASPADSGGSSLDSLFGLSGGSSGDPFAGGNLGDAPFGGAGGGGLPAAGMHDDPLAGLLGAPAAPTHQSVSNHVPEFQGAFTPPQARAERPAAEKPMTAKGADAGVSWEMPAAKPAEARPAPRPMPASPPRAPAAEPAPAIVAPPMKTPPIPAPAAPVAAAPSGDVLLDALIRGVGIKMPDLPRGLTPELMERIGRLLRESTQGTLDLLLARATTKREMRAEVTMIVSSGNNPLKFSPDVNVALTHLISPLGQGFLPPLEALRDAQNDLRAHQFGVMAGMRAAFAAVLQQFAPQRLEARLTQKSFIDSLLPLNRKAKLWELFHELYGEISQEAQEDFQNLFGREFLKAYEAQIKRLAAEPAAGRDPG